MLVVDEDPLARLTIDRQLDALGWEAVPVDGAEDAIRIVELGFVVDVLLTELTLPDRNGVDLALAVVKASPGTRVAFMSSVAPNRPLEPRAAPFLLKPFTVAALASALAGANCLALDDMEDKDR